MVKMVTLLKRRPGMSMEDFIHHYETKHARISSASAIVSPCG